MANDSSLQQGVPSQEQISQEIQRAHINYMQSQLDQQIQIAAHNGFVVLNGQVVPYSIQKNNTDINLGDPVAILENASILNFMQSINAIERLAFFQKLLQLSKSEILKQTGSEDMHQIRAKVLSDFLGEYDITLASWISSSGYSAQEIGKVFHEMVIGNGLFYMQDFIFAVKTIVKEKLIDLPDVKAEQLRRLVHNAAAAISVYQIGVSIFNDYHKSHLAHSKFLNAFESLNYIVRLMALESDLKVELEPNQTVSLLAKKATQLYLDSEVLLQVDPNVAKIQISEENAADIFHVVFNLVNNAWKYSLHPDIKAKYNIESRPVDVEISVIADYLLIEVADYGLSIAKDDESKVLEGVQIHKSRGDFKNIPSTGEGLRGVVDIVRRMKGMVEIKKLEEGNGKKFMVKIPLNTILKDGFTES